MIDRLHRLTRAVSNYDDILSYAWQRRFGKDGSLVTVTDRATGLSFQCKKPADRMLGEVFHTKLYDIPLAPIRDGDVVIDVGANHGFFACYAGQKGARVYAFEPQPDTFELLTKNIERQGQSRTVTAFASAASSTDGVIELYVTEALGGGMSTIVPAFAQNASVPYDRRVKVPSVGLSGFIKGLPHERIRLLKLDCEGAELEILRSLNGDTLQRIDSMVLEYHPEPYPVEELLDVILGWSGFDVSAPNSLVFGQTSSMLHITSRTCIRSYFAEL